jgi:hypothetical protein
VSETTLDAEAELAIRSWAECKADLEMTIGLPADKRAARIEELVAERRALVIAEAARLKALMPHG